MRLDMERSVWRNSFWSWALRGFGFPLITWALVNFGFGNRFPALVPRIADAQAARAPWIGAWGGVCLAGGILILTYWVAVSYLWMLGVMFRQAKSPAELAFNVATFGLFTAAFGGALAYANGPQYFGAALVLTVLPIVHLTMDLAEEPVPRPVYDRALGQINFGKYQAAEWELIQQLEKREDDFQGWMMLAELYARQHKKIEDAARVILDLCQQPNIQPGEISVACHKLADWQMDLFSNPDGARAALELLCRKLPDTHFATMAQQRLKQLPRSAEELQQLRTPKRVQLPPLREPLRPEERKKRSKTDASEEANRLSAALTEDPNDFSAREKLAAILATELGKLDLGIEQLQLLIDLPDLADEQKAKWIGQIAAWELDIRKNETGYETLLKQIIQQFPQTSQAFAAQRRLFLLEQSRPAPHAA